MLGSATRKILLEQTRVRFEGKLGLQNFPNKKLWQLGKKELYIIEQHRLQIQLLWSFLEQLLAFKSPYGTICMPGPLVDKTRYPTSSQIFVTRPSSLYFMFSLQKVNFRVTIFDTTISFRSQFSKWKYLKFALQNVVKSNRFLQEWNICTSSYLFWIKIYYFSCHIYTKRFL